MALPPITSSTEYSQPGHLDFVELRQDIPPLMLRTVRGMECYLEASKKILEDWLTFLNQQPHVEGNHTRRPRKKHRKVPLSKRVSVRLPKRYIRGYKRASDQAEITTDKFEEPSQKKIAKDTLDPTELFGRTPDLSL